MQRYVAYRSTSSWPGIASWIHDHMTFDQTLASNPARESIPRAFLKSVRVRRPNGDRTCVIFDQRSMMTFTKCSLWAIPLIDSNQPPNSRKLRHSDHTNTRHFSPTFESMTAIVTKSRHEIPANDHNLESGL
jgi:hypothetical protein